MTTPDGEPSNRVLIAYALPALPLAVLTLPFFVLVPAFYAQTLGVPLAAVGWALLVVRLVDAVSDPVVGVLADRWRPGFGRRRLWLAAACLPVSVFAWLVLSPPAGAGAGYLALFGSLLSVTLTLALVPYQAWGAELSTTYSGRARVAAWREGVTGFGVILALSAQAVLPLMGVTGEAAALTALGLFVAFGLPLTTAICVAQAPEPRDETSRRLPLREGLGHMAANRPFLRLLLAFFLNGFANGFPATLFLFFVGDRLGAPQAAGPLLLVYFLCGVASVPVWLRLAKTRAKHRVWCWGMALATLCFAPALAAGPDSLWLFALVCVGSGLALGADIMLPPAIQADVIDFDTAASGEQRAGVYVAVWALATKLALALAAGVAFPVLAASGFDPASGARTPQGLWTLAVFYAGVPVILKVAAIAVMWRFPIDAAAQAGLRTAIEARRAAA